MSSRRSERSHKIINYAKLGASDDDDDDFADFRDKSTSKKRARVENSVLNKSTESTVEAENGNIMNVGESRSSQKRLSLEERVFERQVQQAITASQITVVKHIIFKGKGDSEDSAASDNSWVKEESSSSEDEERCENDNASNFEEEEETDDDDDFKAKISSKGTKAKLKQNKKTEKSSELKLTKQCSVPLIDIQKCKKESKTISAIPSEEIFSEKIFPTTVVQADGCLTNNLNKNENVKIPRPSGEEQTGRNSPTTPDSPKATNCKAVVVSPQPTAENNNCPVKSIMVKMSGLKAKNLNRESLSSSKISASVSSVRFPDSKENSPSPKCYTSPLKLPPKGIRIGLSRKVVRSLHPGVKKVL